jgi:hypothetical protein
MIVIALFVTARVRKRWRENVVGKSVGKTWRENVAVVVG